MYRFHCHNLLAVILKKIVRKIRATRANKLPPGGVPHFLVTCASLLRAPLRLRRDCSLWFCLCECAPWEDNFRQPPATGQTPPAEGEHFASVFGTSGGSRVWLLLPRSQNRDRGHPAPETPPTPMRPFCRAPLARARWRRPNKPRLRSLRQESAPPRTATTVPAPTRPRKVPDPCCERDSPRR